MIVIVGGLACVVANGKTESGDRLQPFTIKDSIEISYIVNPAASTVIELREAQPIGVPIISPDRKYFLLITQRGVVSTNTLEATLWLFDRSAVLDYVASKSAAKPIPKQVATLSATSNTPVISSVRWLEDSSRVAFLGKNGSPYQQLFITNISTGSLAAVTKNEAYVSAYDIRGDTIAYTTLMIPSYVPDSQDNFVDVLGKEIGGIQSLLFTKPKDLEDLDEGELTTYASTLHVQRNGYELPISFTMDSKLLRLFIPILSLSPDKKSLITVAPVHEIPPGWAEYQPNDWTELVHLTPDNKYALSDEDPWKASEYVLVDLQTGLVSPLVEAPAGRCLVYWAATKAIWSSDSRRAILSNTFLPLDVANGEADRRQRTRSPAVAMVDVSTREIQPITYRELSPPGTKEWYRLSDLSWNEAEEEVNIRYETGPNPDNSSVPTLETYRQTAAAWIKTPTRTTLQTSVELVVRQDLNHSPVLLGNVRGSRPVLIWDPNPHLQDLNFGKVSLYHWQDNSGKSWSGILALPPDYDPNVHYPLVIQTHGYDATKYFADGQFTTASGGRALAAKGIVVLQMANSADNSDTYDTLEEGPDHLSGFESAINGLSSEGLVDRGRVGVIGFSRTCFHVLYALTNQPDLFAAASITDGLNMGYVEYVMVYRANQETFERINGGVPFGGDLLNWAKNAPGFNLDRVKAPLFISALERGELMYQWEMYSGLRILRKPVDMLWLRKENAPHILVQPHHRYVSQQGAVDWFAFWLKREEDPDPAKAEQYARWHELRKLQEQDQAKTKEQSRN